MLCWFVLGVQQQRLHISVVKPLLKARADVVTALQTQLCCPNGPGSGISPNRTYLKETISSCDPVPLDEAGPGSLMHLWKLKGSWKLLCYFSGDTLTPISPYFGCRISLQ